MPHRPAQPRIHARCRRPDAFDQPAQNDPVGLRQPRFELAVDVQLRARQFRPPHDAVGEGGLEHFGVVAEFDHQAARRCRQQIVERGSQRRPLRAVEGGRDVVRVARQFDQDVAMAFRKFGKVMRLRRAQFFQRRERLLQQRRSAPRASSSSVSLSPARGSARCSDEVSLRRSFVKLLAKASEDRGASPPLPACGRVPRNSASSSTSMAPLKAPCAPPSRHSGCFSSASSVGGSSPFAAASAASRAKMPGGRLRQRIAAGIVEFQIPAAERRRPRAAPARDPASPALRICSGACASRIATAIASASISGLAAAITARLVMPREIFCETPARPAAGAIARSRSMAASPRTPARRARAVPARRGSRHRRA